MSTIIGADAARLAGLQIDQLQKFRSGNLSLDHLERFLNLSSEAREERFSGGGRVVVPTAPTVKFDVLGGLGTIVVPKGFNSTSCLAEFFAKHQGGQKKTFAYYNEDVTDANFVKVSTRLSAGRRLRVTAYKQIVEGTTTSVERIAYLASQGENLLVGAQGLTLVVDQTRNQLPKGKWYSSFDKKEHLWKDADGYHRVPLVDANTDGSWDWDLGRFEKVWDQDRVFLGFRDESLEP